MEHDNLFIATRKISTKMDNQFFNYDYAAESCARDLCASSRKDTNLHVRPNHSGFELTLHKINIIGNAKNISRLKQHRRFRFARLSFTVV